MSLENGCCEKPEKRQAILDQAIRAFAEQGFGSTDVQVIADRAGVGKGTVYRYFHSKEDLFWAAAFEVKLRLDGQVYEAVDRAVGVREKLRTGAIAYANFYAANPQYLELCVQDRAEFRGTGPEMHREHHKQMIQKFAEIVQQGIDAGELRQVDAEQTTLGLGCLLYGASVLGCYLDSVNVMEMTEHAIDIFLRGIST